jgi:hypothetical protein
MYAAGIDDGHLAAQISAWDEKIRQSKAQKGSRKALVAARNQLLLQLATAALAEEGPLPGANAEYQKARQAEAALQEWSTWTPAVRTTRKGKAERWAGGAGGFRQTARFRERDCMPDSLRQ